MEKGKGCFFSSCQKYLHHCKVTAGMSGLFLHPTMLFVQEPELNKTTMGMLADIAKSFTSSTRFSRQKR